jgi:hypothetical protein
MSKKHRRSSGGSLSVPQVTNASAHAGFRATNPNEFKPDYSFIIKDLRFIGILAGFFITVLIVLSFILK